MNAVARAQLTFQMVTLLQNTHSYLILNSGLNKPPLNLGHGLIEICYSFNFM